MRWDSLSDKISDALFERRRRIRTWHKWFAWYPVKIGFQTVWLETIERKMHDGYVSSYWRYQ